MKTAKTIVINHVGHGLVKPSVKVCVNNQMLLPSSTPFDGLSEQQSRAKKTQIQRSGFRSFRYKMFEGLLFMGVGCKFVEKTSRHTPTLMITHR